MRLLLLVIVGISFGISLPAQDRIVHYPAGHDLAYGTINDLAFTSDGHLWVGGQTSLRRYDGSKMESFGHRREIPHSLSNDFIHKLYEAPDGTLWIGHQRGFSHFDPRLEQFHNFRPPALSGQSLTVSQFYAGTDGRLWLATNNSLYAFDPTTEKIIADSLFLKRQKDLDLGRVDAFFPDDEDQVLLGTTTGLFRFRPSNGKLAPIPGGAAAGKEIVRTRNGDLVVANDVHLLRYRYQGDSLRIIEEVILPYPPEDLFRINALIKPTGEDILFVGSTNGLYRVDWREVDDPVVTNYVHDPEDDGSLASNSVFSLARSPDNVLLVGSRRGVDRIALQPSPIKVIRRVPGEVDLCYDVTAGSAVDTGYNLLLLGTQRGLSVVDLTTNDVRCYTPENLPGMRKARLFNVDPGPRAHTFWLGYRQGGTNLLVLGDPENPRIEDVDFGSHDLSTAGVFQVVPDAKGIHWLATSAGLFGYDPVTEQTSSYPSDPTDSLSLSSDKLFTVLNDSKDRLWVGTRNGGLCLRESLDGKEGFRCFRYDEDDPTSLPSDMVLHLFEDQEGRIWISNPEALAVYQEDGTFRTFGLDDGLPYALCYGAFADARGRMWVAFGGNFCRIELTESGEFELREIVTLRDGLAGQANAQYGWSLLPNGQLALSQRMGLNIFHPDSLRQQAGFPPIILTDLELFDHSVSPNQARDSAIAPGYVLPDDLNRLDRINLPPGQDFISIRFSAPEYRPGYTTYFSYRMAGIQEEWTDLEERTFLSFPKLPPGDYLLELRTGDERENWSEEVRTLAIHLAAPWYQRWWALTLFGLTGAGLVFWLARLSERQRQRVKAARLEEREELRRRSARDFHDEAGNHLSRVSLLTTLAERQLVKVSDLGARTRVQGMLEEIGSNTQVLREGMRDFIWALDPDNDRVGELALRLKRFGQELFAHHPADFRAGPFSPELDNLPLQADERRHLMLLLKEAMHNSLKHAPEATSLQLDVKQLGDQLHLSWRDDGPGCKDVADSDGLGMKSMRTRAEKIGADFALHNNEGCCVSVRLPLQDN